MTALSLESFPDEVRGAGSALSLMMLDFGAIAGAPVLGQVAAWFGYQWLFVLVGLAAMASVAVYYWSSLPVWRERRLQRLSETAVPSQGAA